MIKLLSLFCLSLLLVPVDLLAQYNNDELDYRRVRITLVPGLSTNGLDAPDYTARYSYNLIAGYHGGVDGFEIGPVNINKHYMRGVQVGILNVTGGRVYGVQLGGLGNITNDNMSGIQFAGIGNLTNGNAQGLMFSGIANVSKGNTSGISAAGIMNLSGGSIEGIQIAGIGNMARDNLEGIQVAGIFNSSAGAAEGIIISGMANINKSNLSGISITGGVNAANNLEGIVIGGILNAGRDMSGIQISGFGNISQKATGVQIGLINYAREFEGLPIGLLSYYGNGRKNIELWTNENGFTHAGLKLGTRRIYNMLSAGYNPFISGRDVWTVGWSIGGYRTLDAVWDKPSLANYYTTRDFSIHKINEGKWSDTINTLYSYRMIYGRNFSSGFSLFAGPTFNLLISRQEGNEDYVPYSLFKGGSENLDRRFWIGFTAGVQLFGH